MPTYEYKCDNCGHFFEHYQSMKDDKLTKCPECKKNKLKRLIGTGGGLIFKGSGFYLTDYKNKPSEKTADSHSSSNQKKSDKTITDKTDKTDKSDTESKSEKKSPDSASNKTNTTKSKDSQVSTGKK